MTDLEGRSLDEALARAMGWTISQQYGWGLWDTAEGGLAFLPRYHTSLDALLRDIEPVCRERGMTHWTIQSARAGILPLEGYYAGCFGADGVVDAYGPTAATALARAFLVVLTRGTE